MSSSARHRQQRLGVIDAVDIDASRQLLLLRRDNVEHLVLIGGPNDLLVESGIGRLPYRAPIQTPQPASAEGFGSEPARIDSPAPQAGAAAGAAIGGAALAGAAGVTRASLDPLSPPESAPIRSPLTPPPPPPRSLATPVASKSVPAGAGVEFPAADGAKDDAADLTPAPGVAGGERLAPEAPPAREPAKGPFSAVARQLEEALKRPFAAVRPSPVTGIDLDEASPPAKPSVKPPVEAAGGRENGDKGVAAEEVRAPVPPAPPVQATLPIPPLVPPRDEGRFAARTSAPPSPAVRSDSVPADESAPIVDEKPARKPAFDSGAAFESLVSVPPHAPVAPPVSAVTPPAAAPASSGARSPSVEEVAPVDRPAPRQAEIIPPQAPPRATPPFSAPVPPPPVAPAPASAAPVSPPPAPSGQTFGEVEIIGPGDPVGIPDTLKVPETLKASPEAARSQPAPKEGFDLSSLENIEAEFARLLGRTAPGKDK